MKVKSDVFKYLVLLYCFETSDQSRGGSSEPFLLKNLTTLPTTMILVRSLKLLTELVKKHRWFCPPYTAAVQHQERTSSQPMRNCETPASVHTVKEVLVRMLWFVSHETTSLRVCVSHCPPNLHVWWMSSVAGQE